MRGGNTRDACSYDVVMTMTVDPQQIEFDATRQERIDQARAYAIEAARACADRRCRNVRVLDVTGLSPVCDFFVLATAASARQLSSVSREVEDLAVERDMRPLGRVRRAEPNERWVAVDAVDVIVHLFSDEARLFYDLDNLWGDGKEVDWQTGREAAPRPAFVSSSGDDDGDEQ